LWRFPFKTGQDLHKLEDSLVEGTEHPLAIHVILAPDTGAAYSI